MRVIDTAQGFVRAIEKMGIQSGFKVEDTAWQGLVEVVCSGVWHETQSSLKSEESVSLLASQTRASSILVTMRWPAGHQEGMSSHRVSAPSPHPGH